MVTNPCNVNNPWLRGEQFYGVESVPNIIHCLNGHAQWPDACNNVSDVTVSEWVPRDKVSEWTTCLKTYIRAVIHLNFFFPLVCACVRACAFVSTCWFCYLKPIYQSHNLFDTSTKLTASG